MQYQIKVSLNLSSLKISFLGKKSPLTSDILYIKHEMVLYCSDCSTPHKQSSHVALMFLKEVKSCKEMAF